MKRVKRIALTHWAMFDHSCNRNTGQFSCFILNKEAKISVGELWGSWKLNFVHIYAIEFFYFNIFILKNLKLIMWHHSKFKIRFFFWFINCIDKLQCYKDYKFHWHVGCGRHLRIWIMISYFSIRGAWSLYITSFLPWKQLRRVAIIKNSPFQIF